MKKITGSFEIIKDSNGSEYFVLNVDKESIQEHVNFLKTKVDPAFIEAQQKRDHESYHVTILNAIQYGSLKKKNPEALNELIAKISQQKPSFISHGIGTVSGERKQNKKEIEDGEPPQHIQAYFMILENHEIDQLRKEALYDWNITALHCTLAFKTQDVHGVDKGISSLIYEKNETMMDNQSNFKMK